MILAKRILITVEMKVYMAKGRWLFAVSKVNMEESKHTNFERI